MKDIAPTAAQRALIAIRELKAENATLRARVAEPIAIIGMACRFPGGADSPEKFWDLLTAERSVLSPIPKDRWNTEQFYDPDPSSVGTYYVDQGGFLDDIAGFDATLFGISDHEAMRMDPQQRLLLELCWEALEIANMAPSVAGGPVGPSVGVFTGLASSGYARHSVYSKDPAQIDGFSVTGFAPGIASGRISYLFGLQGPTLTVDTACSSSLVALHLACQSLRAGECDAALAGAANLLVAPEEFVFFCQVAALSPSSTCRAFDKEADGYVRGEGGGILALKRLSDAKRDDDKILAVICGSSVNHDGRSNGLTAPNGLSQQALLRNAWCSAGVTADDIDYVEAHGTGTPLGDPIEINALGRVLGESVTEGRAPTIVGTCKPNIGHLEAAAGVAGVIKTVLALQNERIPANINLSEDNPHIAWSDLPITVARAEHAWPARDAGRYAGVSGFGFSGTNAHVVLSDAPQRQVAPQLRQDGVGAFELVVSAASKSALSAMLNRLSDWAETTEHRHEPCFVSRLAQTLARGRALLSHAVIVRVARETDLAQSLRVAAKDLDLGGLIASREEAERARQSAPDQHGLLHGLPTYPFQRTRFWPEETASLAGVPENVSTADQKNTLDDLPKPARDDGAAPTTLLLGQEAIAQALKVPLTTVIAAQGPEELAIDSVTLVKARFLIEQRLGRSIPIQAFLGVKNWDAFERLLGGASDAAQTGAPPKVTALERHQIPMTPLQEAYWVGRRLGNDAERASSHFYLEFEAGAIEPARLEEAFDRLVDMHDMLRAQVSGNGIEILPSTPRFEIPVHDCRSEESEAIADLSAHLRSQLASHPRQDGAWPLFSIDVLRHRQGCRVLFGIDELIADGASIGILLREWSMLVRKDRPTRLEPPGICFADYAGFLRDRLAGADDALDYWLEKSCDLPSGPNLPRLAASERRGRRRLKAILGPTVLTGLKARAEASGISLTSLVLACFCATLSKGTEQSAFTIVTTFFNRWPIHPDVDRLVGPLSSTSLFRWDAKSLGDIDGLGTACQEQLLADADHSKIDGVSLHRELRRRKLIDSTFSLPVVFTSMIETFSTDDELTETPDWSTDWTYAISQTPQVLLDHQIGVRRDTLVMTWDIAADIVDVDFVEALFAAYGDALTTLSSGDDEVVRTHTLPLNAVQAAYAFGRQQSGENCHIYQELCMEKVELDVLEHAWNELIARHAMLRASVDRDGSFVVPSNRDPYKPECHTAPPEHARARMAASRRDPGIWPLFEVAVSLDDADGPATIHVSIDMIIADWPSIQTIYREFAMLVAGERLEPLEPEASILASAETRALARPAKDAGAHWRPKFEAMPAAQLKAVPGHLEGGHVRVTRDLSCWQNLQARCRNEGLDPQDVLLASYSSSLAPLLRGPFAIVIVDFTRRDAAGRCDFSDRSVADHTVLSWVTGPKDPMAFRNFAAALTAQRQGDIARWPESGIGFNARYGPHRRSGGGTALPFVFSRLIDSGSLALPGGVSLGQGVSVTQGVVLDDVTTAVGPVLRLTWDADLSVLPRDAVEAALDRHASLLERLAFDPEAWKIILADPVQADQTGETV